MSKSERGYLYTPREVVGRFFENSDFFRSFDHLNSLVTLLEEEGVSDEEAFGLFSRDFRMLATVIDQNWHMTRSWKEEDIREALRVTSLRLIINYRKDLKDAEQEGDEMYINGVTKDLEDVRRLHSELLRRI